MPRKKPPRATGKDGKIDWIKQLRYNMEFAKRTVLSKGEVRPMFMIMSPTDIVLVDADMAPGAKQGMRSLIKLMCYAYNAIGFTMISEAWMKTADDIRPGESLADYEARTVLPSQSERRIEAVVVQSVYYDNNGERRSVMLAREIVRDAAAKPTGLTGIDFLKDEQGDMRGPSVEILPEHRPTPAEQRKAQEVLALIHQMGGMAEVPLGDA